MAPKKIKKTTASKTPKLTGAAQPVPRGSKLKKGVYNHDTGKVKVYGPDDTIDPEDDIIAYEKLPPWIPWSFSRPTAGESGTEPWTFAQPRRVPAHNTISSVIDQFEKSVLYKPDHDPRMDRTEQYKDKSISLAPEFQEVHHLDAHQIKSLEILRDYITGENWANSFIHSPRHTLEVACREGMATRDGMLECANIARHAMNIFLKIDQQLRTGIPGVLWESWGTLGLDHDLDIGEWVKKYASKGDKSES